MTKEIYIDLNPCKNYTKFLDIITKELTDGKIVVSSISHPEKEINGTSILALFTLDLSKPVKITYQGNNEEEKEKIFQQIQQFASPA